MSDFCKGLMLGFVIVVVVEVLVVVLICFIVDSGWKRGKYFDIVFYN